MFLAGWILPTENGKYLIIAPFAESSEPADILVGHAFQFRYGRYAVAGEGEHGAVAEDG